MRIVAHPIDPEAYAPYGSVVCARDASSARPANHRTAQAWDALAVLESHRKAARCTASLFRCAAQSGAELPVRWLERHAHSTQMFVPMRARRYLVIVARGARAPDLKSLAAFVVAGPQAITYAPGTWHHPMIALDEDADFVNVIFSDGTASDCDEIAYDVPPVVVRLPGA